MPYLPNELLSAYLNEQGVDLSVIDPLLQQAAPDSPNLPLYREMMQTVLRMACDDASRWNAKITLQALRELDQSFRSLERYKARRKVTVFGSARTPQEHPIYSLARELGAQLAHAQLMVITGAGGGIMAAAHEGAGTDNSLGFNIRLPFEQHANATVEGTDKLLPFHFFFIRKLFFVKEADALVLCPGGFGTLDEALEVLTLIQTGKSPLVPVVLLDTPDGSFWRDALSFIKHQLEDNRYILPNDLKLVRLVHSPEEAVEEITQFYRNYHSSRWLKTQFVLRMQRPLSAIALAEMQERFADLCLSGDYVQKLHSDGPYEDDGHSQLPRLVFTFTGRDQGRLRELIDFINVPEHWSTSACP
ncbi:TIGR00730 family Rossman fold protein [Pseudomonas sp. S75]|uniref:LOG family protein n=1 Tax=unclassified Pseudomonas TaxID=196821 RepID=UPI0019068B56|nr:MULTISPECIES: TIGR00730 family Rossman fold protein [unclassified Pseudomonas]MBJ9977795.1 TIGR00730 family Rossman fold protein [Pseudomonas sp. S30]MBK0155424.1 TIGR00730 family Rossman fold protein [Pseudomonas sp. S75]